MAKEIDKLSDQQIRRWIKNGLPVAKSDGGGLRFTLSAGGTAVLGARLRECVELVLAVKGKTAFQIFGSPDDLKFRSSLTLFSQAEPGEPLFKRALAKYFGGIGDSRTLELLA